MTEQTFLELLAGSDPAIPAHGIALVVAHPDDETLAVGAQLPRLKGLTILHVTDGAPRDCSDSVQHGYATPEDYAAARRSELRKAMTVAEIRPDALVGLNVPDQEAALRLAEIAGRLAQVFSERGIELVLTHAYEGGHPDHDAVAFCVHAVRRLLGKSEPRMGIVEMPFYHADAAGWVRQRFILDPSRKEVVILLGEDDRTLKGRMLEAHLTQRETLLGFSLQSERFRPAPDYDFKALPNGGNLLYERYGWGMTGRRWQDLARKAMKNLGLEAPACA